MCVLNSISVQLNESYCTRLLYASLRASTCSYTIGTCSLLRRVSRFVDPNVFSLSSRFSLLVQVCSLSLWRGAPRVPRTPAGAVRTQSYALLQYVSKCLFYQLFKYQSAFQVSENSNLKIPFPLFCSGSSFSVHCGRAPTSPVHSCAWDGSAVP